MPQAVVEPLVSQGFRRLAFQGSDLPADFLNPVGYAGEVLVDEGELVEGFAPLRLVFCYSRRLFENRTPFAGV